MTVRSLPAELSGGCSSLPLELHGYSKSNSCLFDLSSHIAQLYSTGFKFDGAKEGASTGPVPSRSIAFAGPVESVQVQARRFSDDPIDDDLLT